MFDSNYNCSNSNRLNVCFGWPLSPLHTFSYRASTYHLRLSPTKYGIGIHVPRYHASTLPVIVSQRQARVQRSSAPCHRRCKALHVSRSLRVLLELATGTDRAAPYRCLHTNVWPCTDWPLCSLYTNRRARARTAYTWI